MVEWAEGLLEEVDTETDAYLNSSARNAGNIV